VILIISLIIFVSACAGPLGDASKALNDWDYKTAYRLVKLWAGQRSPEAQFNLGFMYYKGEGVSQNYPEATKWLRKAAEQGHVKAQFLLSSIVAKWLRKAADQGDGYSQANLGHMYYGGLYYGGLGVPQDYSEAAKWYRKAADQGIASAQTNLGAMYDKGEGVAQDYAEAAKWYRKAAEQRNASRPTSAPPRQR
jgi:TPR repeat protein